MRGYSKLDDIEYKVFERGVVCKKSNIFNRFPEGLLVYTDNGDRITVYCRILSNFLHPHTMPDLISNNIRLPKIDGQYKFLCIVPKKGFGLKLMRIRSVVDGLEIIHGVEAKSILVFNKNVPGDKRAGQYFVKGINEDEFEKVLKEYQVTYGE